MDIETITFLIKKILLLQYILITDEEYYGTDKPIGKYIYSNSIDKFSHV